MRRLRGSRRHAEIVDKFNGGAGFYARARTGAAFASAGPGASGAGQAGATKERYVSCFH
jgi:hypothetical protein